EAVEGVDFDGAGAGTCLIWYLRYEDGLVGAEMGLNANDLMGCFDLSNSVEVVRNDPTSGKTSVSLFPNPSTDKLNISVGSKDVKNVSVSLFDFGGTDITDKMRRNSEEGLSFDVNGIPAGIYLVRVNDGRTVTTKKVIIR
ncbi:T9SS type A sorting domain-containing protein, partial [Maribacter sp.]